MMRAIVAIALLLTGSASATWKPEYGASPPDEIAWFNNARTTPEAHARLGYAMCCDHSDRFKTKFMPGSKADEWFYQQDGQWKLIPADVIHTEADPKMPEQLRAEGVLFIFPAESGEPTCFWPPESGG
jgi:hypothetical protein